MTSVSSKRKKEKLSMQYEQKTLKEKTSSKLLRYKPDDPRNDLL